MSDADDPVGSGAGEEASTENADSDAGAVRDVSPLAEYFDAFRSLSIIHKALRESAESDVPESDPLRRWIEDVQSVATNGGYGDRETGYGAQVARSSVSMQEYRTERGTGERVTDFEAISVRPLSRAVTALLAESLSDLSSWVVPVAPESGVSLPVVVESDAELQRGRALLDEFPAEPAVFADEATDEAPDVDDESSTSERAASGESESEPPDRGSSSPTPVENVRGVSDSVAAALRDAGYERLVDLQTASDEALVSVDGVSEQRVQLIRAAVGSQ